MLMADERKRIDPELRRHYLREMKREFGGKIIGNRLMPISDALGGLVQQQDVSCSVSGDWFAVNTEPKHETLAREEIADHGVVVYLPLFTRQERHGKGRMRTVSRPMFPGYLFARCELNDRNYHAIKSARGVHRLLGNGRPHYIDPGALEVVRLKEAEFAEKEARRVAIEEAARIAKEGGKSGIIWHFTAGDRVRIKTGPFASFYAELDSAVDSHDRLKALVHIFGRKVPTDLSAFDIEAL